MVETHGDMLETWNTSGSGMIKNLNDVAFVNNLGVIDLVIVGEESTVIYSNNITAATPTFTVVNAGITAPVNASVSSRVSTNGTSFFITVNDPTDETASTYTMPVGGTTWTQENDFTAGGNLNAIDFYSVTGAYAAGVDGRLYKNADVMNSSSRWKMIPNRFDYTFCCNFIL